MSKRPIVLVVEDDIQVSALLTSLLHDDGFTAFPVGSVADAVNVLATGKLSPSAILLGLQLPNGRGMDVADALLKAANDRACFFIYTGEFNLDFADMFYGHFNGRLQGFWVKGDIKPTIIPRMIRTGLLRCQIQQRLINMHRAEAVKTTAPITGESYATTLVRKTSQKFGGLRTWEKLLLPAGLALGALGAALAKMGGWDIRELTPGVVGLLLVGLGSAVGAYYTARMTEREKR